MSLALIHDRNAEPDLVLYNLSTSFDVPPGPQSLAQKRSAEVPSLFHGFAWSNLVDRAWLFGGKPSDDASGVEFDANSIWRFEWTNGQGEWSKLNIKNGIDLERPFRGAGCNAPDLQMGFYLGGMSSRPSWNDTNETTFLHQLFVFDTQHETLKVLPVPDFVPVVNQTLVFINTGSRRGGLVALGGSVEQGGNVTLVSFPLFIQY